MNSPHFEPDWEVAPVDVVSKPCTLLADSPAVGGAYLMFTDCITSIPGTLLSTLTCCTYLPRSCNSPTIRKEPDPKFWWTVSQACLLLTSSSRKQLLVRPLGPNDSRNSSVFRSALRIGGLRVFNLGGSPIMYLHLGFITPFLDAGNDSPNRTTTTDIVSPYPVHRRRAD